MKHQLKHFLSVALVAISSLVLASDEAVATGEPIPGVDIIVQKKPGGKPAIIKTDKNGKFDLSKLPPGKYTLTLAGNGSYNSAKSNSVGKTATLKHKEEESKDSPLLANNNYNSSKSNSAGMRHSVDAKQGHVITIAKGLDLSNFEPIEIEVTARSPHIRGQVLQSDMGIQEPGIK